MKIYFQKLNENCKTPSYRTNGDFGCDCIATSEEEVAPGVWKYGLGFRYNVDRLSLEDQINRTVRPFDPGSVDACAWNISIDARPKSGIWKHGMILANSIGTLDEFYRGEAAVVFYHVMPNMPRYKVGDPVIQLCVSVAPLIEWTERSSISTDTGRGENGFGALDEMKND